MTHTEFFTSLHGKTVAVCGIGHNNLSVIYQLREHGIAVRACDKRSRTELGDVADGLDAAGVTLRLGEDYLDHLEGVDLVLRTPGMKPYLPQFNAARAAGIPVTSEMELFFSLCPAPMYAVTGSDGKTTTTTVIAGLLSAAGNTVHLGGNIGNPMLPEIAKVSDGDVAVMELSSFQLTMMTQSPSVAVVTNVAPNHLDWHTDMQEYIDAKRNLVAHQTAGDRAVLNADNEHTVAFAESCAGDVWWFSRRHPVERGAYLGDDGLLYVTDGTDTVAVLPAADIRIPGVHNIENYLAAFAAVYGTVPVEVMAEYARTFGGVPHRCELVRERHGVRWYNDSIGSSPSRTIAGLEAFDRPVILIAGGYDKHIPYDPLGPVAARTVKHAVLLGATASAIESVLRRDAAEVPITRVASMEAAVAAAADMAGAGDIVFLSPASASFDMYRNFEERGNHFKRLVQELS